jgi:starch synthase (maltosyl-transferring)
MRIYYVHPLLAGPLSQSADECWKTVCARAKALGFDTLMTAPLWAPDPDGNPYVPADPDGLNPALHESGDLAAVMTALSRACATNGLALMIDLALDRVAVDGAMARAHPDWYGPQPGVDALRDPRKDLHERHALLLRTENGAAPAGFIDNWIERLGLWVQNGVAGFRCQNLHHLAAPDWRNLIEGTQAVRPDCRFLAWTPGLDPWQLQALAGAGFDGVFSSLPWWDYRSPWFIEEYARLRAIAPVIAPVEAPYAKRVAAWRGDEAGRHLNAVRAIWTATVAGDGVLVPMGFEDGTPHAMDMNGGGIETPKPVAAKAALAAPLHKEIQQANQWLARTASAHGPLHSLLGPRAGVTALFRGDGRPYAVPGTADSTARLVVLNPDDNRDAQLDWKLLQSRLPESFSRMDALDTSRPANNADELPVTLDAGAVLRLVAKRAEPVRTPASDESRLSVTAAVRASRVVIERVEPAVDDGGFPIKRTLGQPVQVQADVYMDGHDHIAVALLWRAADEKDWQRVPMALLNNDRWQAEFAPVRTGRHYFVVQAWADVWDTFREGLEKKHAAGVDISLETAEGRGMLKQALERVPADATETVQALQHALQVLGGDPPAAKPRRGRKTVEAEAPVRFPAPSAEQIEVLLSPATAAAMQEADDRLFETTTPVEYAVTVDRPGAAFSSWYEIFPRSQSNDPDRHGTFIDVIGQLPRIRAMGFDTLYFPPIHPIGTRNRKGRNNSLKAEPGDLGSPYAIGSAEGGHDALHPQLGSLKDFKRLIDAAHGHGLEIALDFAIQCSPDHPWLKEHPEWFDWRADGSLKYAENPPKKYEDIVNVDFYGSKAGASKQAPLWRALRDVVLFWVAQGIRAFRVDNPHTKPLPFWQWMIADVQSRHPDVLFLSEAFTRPKMMYRLAKVGFTQSYTYFTWRETKQEFTEYLTELNQAPQAEFFRPNFFVNTPDINPHFLQASGRGGFLIRAALAATLSGLWGVYNGFELGEASAMPGKEEYLDSEKYQIRVWDHDRPGNIVREVTQLNLLRRANPALHTHLGLRFHTAYNDRVLFFSKATPNRDNVILVAISLDPFGAQSATLEVPLWEFGLPDHGTLHAEDLVDGSSHAWQGKQQTVYLHPGQPYRIWRVSPA